MKDDHVAFILIIIVLVVSVFFTTIEWKANQKLVGECINLTWEILDDSKRCFQRTNELERWLDYNSSIIMSSYIYKGEMKEFNCDLLNSPNDDWLFEGSSFANNKSEGKK